jgi:hypothetical protein
MNKSIDQKDLRQRQIQVGVAIFSACLSTHLYWIPVIHRFTRPFTWDEIQSANPDLMFIEMGLLMLCILRSGLVVSAMPNWKSNEKIAWAFLLTLGSPIAVPVFSIWSAAMGNRMPARLPFYTVLALWFVISVVCIMRIWGQVRPM